MSSAQMRDYVANKYPSKAWKDKVAKMSDKQIVAVYFRMIGREDMTDFDTYNNILSAVGGCIFAYSGGFGWCLHGWRSQKGFSTPEEAYEDACREIEGGED